MISISDLLNNSNGSETRSTISLTAIIDTALCVGAGGSSGSLADKPIVRTADGRLLIPASQLKGRLRHECEKLARGLGWAVCESPLAATMCPQRAGLPNEQEFHRREYGVTDEANPKSDRRPHCIICQLFGNPALPSHLLFEDLISSESPENLPPEVLRPGVTINRRRRTAEEKKLYLLETSPANIELKLAGKIQILPANSASLPIFANFDTSKALIIAALKHIKALGGSKSTGLGWLHWELEPNSISSDNEAWKALLPNSLKDGMPK
ncbi:RAMP superfamily CRISPR-associated protein [Merismopedia glauca]|uniref:CRISPR-associated protein Csm3 n=1 Tax=Merismopedia glauca CCAP 1448/3 TaxID=1296344 RepID=A0A2T1C9Y4_9CYAN|nr:RAMP superfamily CRISPR-associated protein [Merismopedia glauca]PSB04978.1 CRISPR-associated protein Csm3 [Merismopedia glauca CCAP 1448/3]